MKCIINVVGPRYNRGVKMAGAGFDPLFWDDAYPIALMLAERHPQADPACTELAVLHGWVTALPGFSDDPRMMCAQYLVDIQAEWVEIGGLSAKPAT